tara:strand:- start:599 stop:1846 length:1248 start_codon:yes stop_codon:yes gene_type:complete
MAATISSNPGVLVYPGGQRLMYGFTTSTTITSDFRFVVQVFEFNTTEIGKFYLTPNTNDTSFFDLSQVIEGRLKRDIVDNSGDALWGATLPFAQSPQNSKGYQVRVGEFVAGVETLNQDSDDIYLINGYMQQRLGLNPGFADYYPTASTKKVWLTDKSSVSDVISYKMSAEDEAVFGFLYNDITGGSASYVRQQIFDGTGLLATVFSTISVANGSNLPSSAAFVAGGTLVYASVGPSNVLSRNPTWPTLYPDWTKMESVVINGSFAVIGSVLKITRDCSTPKNTPTQMAFSNSVGGYDYIRWDGRRVQNLTKQDKSYRPLQGTWDAASFTIDPTGSDTAIYQKDVTERYALNALMSSVDFPLLGIAFRSRQIFIKIGADWLPCTLAESSLQIQSEPISKLTAVSVTAEISQGVRC